MKRSFFFALVVFASQAAPLQQPKQGNFNHDIDALILPLHSTPSFFTREQLLNMPKDTLAELLLQHVGGSLKVTDVHVGHQNSDISIGWPPIWPYPSSFSNGTFTIQVKAAGFSFDVSNPSDDISLACERNLKLIFPHKESTGTTVHAIATMNLLKVIVANPVAQVENGSRGKGIIEHSLSLFFVTPPQIQLDTDESYTIQIEADGTASLTALTQVSGHGVARQRLYSICVPCHRWESFMDWKHCRN
jgi:hypothetical protein